MIIVILKTKSAIIVGIIMGVITEFSGFYAIAYFHITINNKYY